MYSRSASYIGRLGRGSPQSSSSAKKPGSKGPLFLVIAFLIESYIGKSVFFTGNDPTTVHYAVSGVIAALMGFYLGKCTYEGRHLAFLIAFVAFVWSIAGSIAIGYTLNYVAAVAFALL